GIAWTGAGAVKSTARHGARLAAFATPSRMGSSWAIRWPPGLRRTAMQIPVLIEPVAGNGFRARGMETAAVSAEGATQEEALENLKKLLHSRLPAGARL